MIEALARSVAVTAADVLGKRAASAGVVTVSDEAIGAYLWYERAFRDHDTLVQIINFSREILDQRDREAQEPRQARRRPPRGRRRSQSPSRGQQLLLELVVT